MGFLSRLFGKSINYQELLDKGAIIIDVRSPAEYKAGHIKSSINIPLEQVKSYIPEFKKKKKTIIAVCRSGARSSMACSILKSGGVENYNGGAWTSLNKKIS